MLMRSVRGATVLVAAVLFSGAALAATSSLGSRTTISGEQKQWHRVSLTFEGPSVSETSTSNPFRNYRLNVTFKHSASGRTFLVPGYFAADGNAANTGATSGTKWRVNFAPDATGTWTYVVSFRSGTDVAVTTSSTAGVAASFNGESGSFTVDATNKTGADFRAKGRLREVGQHYLQHMGTKEYFIKAGAGSPENFLAYSGFDNTPAGRKPVHHYTPHVGHYRTGDPTWKDGKGKGIIGAINYLAGKRMNSVYFLTMNVGGDGDDVFPWTQKSERYRFDVSKLTQWEIVFDHMERRGIHLHVITQERENDQLLDGGGLGVQRKLYYRELVARFGHHLGLTWNLGEENSNTSSQRSAFADYINAIDPYFHPFAVHTWPTEGETIYSNMLGHPVINAASLQVSSPANVHSESLKWVKRSASTGQKWVVAVDEIGAASVGVVPDSVNPTHSDIMHRVLWGSLLAGASGVEWYFGYNYAHHDLTCEDWTSRDKMWTLSDYAAQFMRTYMPLPLVANHNAITSATNDYCFGKPGVAYAIYLPDGATTNITVPTGEAYSVHWFNPRKGGALVTGTVASIKGGTAAVGKPPVEQTSDWVALLRRTTSTTTPPTTTTPTAMAVTSLTLINTTKQTALRTLTNGSTITFSVDGSALNVKANVSGTVGSVAFFLDGKLYHTENSAPFALGGDNAGVYLKWTPTVGGHTLRVVPYQSDNRGGSIGTALETTFTVRN